MKLNSEISNFTNAKNMKYSSLEKLMNFGLIFIFTLLIILSIIASILRGVYYHHNNLDEVDEKKITLLEN